MKEKIQIRAKSTLKLSTEGGNKITYEYPKGVPIDALLRDVLRADHFNKGSEECRKNVLNMIECFDKM